MIVVTCLVLAGCSTPPVAPAPTTSAPASEQAASPTPTPEPDPVLVGAGDIANGGPGDDQTAALLDGIPGTVFTTGDNAYDNGTAADFANFYDPTWGRHRARTRPAPGNHDYNTAGAAGYFGYFGANAGPPGLGYYSYDLGRWHIIALNSNVAMEPGSAQEQWLRADLADTDDRQQRRVQVGLDLVGELCGDGQRQR